MKRDGVFKRNGWWWIDFVDADGKRHRQKAAPTYELAKLKYRDMTVAIAKGEVLGVRAEGIRLARFVERHYWPAVAPRWSVAERERARVILDTWILPRFGARPLARLGVQEIQGWQTERLASAAPGTVNKELMRLKHVLNRAVEWGYLKSSPAARVKKLHDATGRARYLQPEERATLLAAAAPTLRAYIVAALATGARRGELVDLKWSAIDRRTGLVTFIKTKNGHPRTLPLARVLRDLLDTLPRPLAPDAYVLPRVTPQALTVAFGRLVRALNLPDLRFHDLRHDAASVLTMAGASQREVMEILGHRDPRMTVRYQHLAPDHLRDVMRALDAAFAADASANSPVSTGTITAPPSNRAR